jgi:hypothetical protein
MRAVVRVCYYRSRSTFSKNNRVRQNPFNRNSVHEHGRQLHGEHGRMQKCCTKHGGHTEPCRAPVAFFKKITEPCRTYTCTEFSFWRMMAEFWRSTSFHGRVLAELRDGGKRSGGTSGRKNDLRWLRECLRRCLGCLGSAGDGGFGSAGKCFARCGMIYVINLNLRLDVHFKTQKSYLHV